MSKLRPTIVADANDSIRAATRLLELKGKIGGVTQSCISCTTFAERDELCTRWNARPPARVIAFGCNDYQDNEDIPF